MDSRIARLLGVAGITVLLARPAAALDIQIVAGSSLNANSAALTSFNNAAATWERFLGDPITVTINANLGTFDDPNTIGGATPAVLQASYNTVRSLLISDAADEPSNAVVNSLPTLANFDIALPGNRAFSGNLWFTKAAGKAMGFVGLDAQHGVSDGSIIFNQDYDFYYGSPADTPEGQVSFEFVALHEIGHALGFLSIVDPFDQIGEPNLIPSLPVHVLDLYRFAEDDAPTPGTFGTAERNAVPGEDAVFSDGTLTLEMSTGVFAGDGNQASHWKDDAQTLQYIGAMDPTLQGLGIFELRYNDLRALDLIGWDVIPEPGTTAVVALTGLLLLGRRRRAII